MSRIKTWDPSDGDAAMNLHGSQTNYVPGIGCGGATVLTCPTASAIDGWFGSRFGTDINGGVCYGHYITDAPTAMTVRAMMALRCLDTSDNILAMAMAHNGSNFFGEIQFKYDGTVHLYINDGAQLPVAHLVTSSTPGAMPNDGLYHGVQFALEFPGASTTTVNYSVVIDNVLVLSGTYTHATWVDDPPLSCFSTWGIRSLCTGPFEADLCNDFIYNVCLSDVSIYSFRLPTSPSSPVLWQAVGHVEIDDAVNITTFPSSPCTGATALGSATPTATVTGMSVQCGSNRLIVTGAGFRTYPAPTIVLEGAGGASIPFTLNDGLSSPTQLTLDLTDPFLAGRYCITVTNNPGCWEA